MPTFHGKMSDTSRVNSALLGLLQKHISINTLSNVTSTSEREVKECKIVQANKLLVFITDLPARRPSGSWGFMGEFIIFIHSFVRYFTPEKLCLLKAFVCGLTIHCSLCICKVTCCLLFRCYLLIFLAPL